MPVSDAEALARQRQCRRDCPHYRHCPARHGEYCAGGGEGPDDWKRLDKDVWKAGAEDWCPRGLWTGLTIPDLAIWRETQRRLHRNHQVQFYGPVLEAAVEGMDTADRDALLDRVKRTAAIDDKAVETIRQTIEDEGAARAD